MMGVHAPEDDWIPPLAVDDALLNAGVGRVDGVVVGLVLE
jgi:hypothetical protein